MQIETRLDKKKMHANFRQPRADCGFSGDLLPGCVHKAAILCLHLSKDGRYMAASSADHTATVWDMDSQSLLHCLHGHLDEVSTVDNSYSIYQTSMNP